MDADAPSGASTLILFSEGAEFGSVDSFITRAPSFTKFVIMFDNDLSIVRGFLLLVPGDEEVSSSESPDGVLQFVLLHVAPTLFNGGGGSGGSSAGAGSSTGTMAGCGTSSACGGSDGGPSLLGSVEMHPVLSSFCISSIHSAEQYELATDDG